MVNKSIGVVTAMLITGGSDRLLESIYTRFVKKGYSVTLYATYPSKAESRFVSSFEKKGIIVKTPPCSIRWILLFFGLLLSTPLFLVYPVYSRFNRQKVIAFYKRIYHSIECSLIDPVYHILVWYRISREHNKNNYSWISGYHYTVYPVLLKLKNRLSIPVFYTEISSPKGRAAVRQKSENFNMNVFDKIFVPSAIIGRELEEYEHLQKGYTIIPFFIDIPETRYLVPEKPALSFGIIARLSPEKRLDFLITMLSVIKKSNPSVLLVLVGTGPQEKELKQLSESLGVTSSIKFIRGFGNLDEVMAEIDIFTLCSDIEGMPLTLIEAMCYGKPILATPVGSIPEMVIDGYNGFIVTREDPAEFVLHIRELLENVSRFRYISHNSRMTFENKFNPDILFEKLLKECESS
jgi:glycosyltransferase involved in cell wall biosynthesis